jgi:polysaccharide biosynthesis/export protein
VSRTLVHATLAAIITLSLSGCPGAARSYNYKAEPDPRKKEYVVGPSDVLNISVWGHSDLTSSPRVRPDGTVTMPLAGDIKASGKTANQVKELIKKRLAAFISTAKVTVAVTEVNSYRFTVSGNITRGGIFSPRRYITVSEGIAMAGGPNRFASPEKTTLIRTTKKGKVKRIPINYKAISKGQKLEQNIVILRGDTIYVP